MVDVIVRLTAIAVLALAALNAFHGAAVLIRIARRVARRQPHLGLWLPLFTSIDDIRGWLALWRAALADPSLVAVRNEIRTVVGRHLYLALMSQTWAMAVAAIAPPLA